MPKDGPAPLFKDNFSGGGGLVGDSGSWSVSGGVFRQASCSSGTPDSKVPGAPWAEITASADLRVDSLCGASFHQAALLVRVGSIIGCQNYYYCCFVDFDHNEIRVGKMAGACATGNWTGSHVPKPLKTKTWYHLDFKAGGNAMTCTLAGGNLPSPVRHTFTDGGTPYASGSAGIGTFGLQASFDNFVVRKN